MAASGGHSRFKLSQVLSGTRHPPLPFIYQFSEKQVNALFMLWLPLCFEIVSNLQKKLQESFKWLLFSPWAISEWIADMMSLDFYSTQEPYSAAIDWYPVLDRPSSPSHSIPRTQMPFSTQSTPGFTGWGCRYFRHSSARGAQCKQWKSLEL